MLFKILAARRLIGCFVTHTSEYFKWVGWNLNYDETTLFEAISWDFMGRVLLVRRFYLDDKLDPRPQVNWHWVDVKFIKGSKQDDN